MSPAYTGESLEFSCESAAQYAVGDIYAIELNLTSTLTRTMRTTMMMMQRKKQKM